MTISLIFAWIAVFFAIADALKYIARISKSSGLNRFFHKIHIPAGIMLVVTGLFHGLVAGNFSDTSLSEASIGTELLSLNWGTACLIVAVLLGISYVLRRIFRKKWMPVHRILTVCMIALVAVHVIDTGIQLPSRIFKTSSRNSQSVSESNLNNYTSFSGAQLADGVYEGSAEGFESTIKVSVTVKNGTVTNIEILEENDTPDFFERAKRIISDIIDKQSLNVDAVSGATYSSVGILNAVNNALEGAVTDGSLENNNTELPSSDRKHGNFNKKNEPGNLGGGNKRHTQ